MKKQNLICSNTWSHLHISVSDGTIEPEKEFRHKTLEERATEYGGTLNLDGEFDWGEYLVCKLS